MTDIKLPQVGLELTRLLTTTDKSLCFNVDSRVDIDCAKSSLSQTCCLSQESIKTESRGSWVHLILHHIVTNFKEKW